MWRWLLLLVAARLGLPCPQHCNCSIGDDWEYDCEGRNDTQVLMKARLNYYVYVECGGDDTPCALLPRVDLAHGGVLPKITTQRCSPAIVPCLLDAANASDATTLMLMNPKAELMPEDVRGMNLKTLLMFDAHSVSRIPSAALAAVPSLRSLRINDAAQLRLSEAALAAAAALDYLELSADGITDLPAGAFRGLAKVKQLQLWRNDIQSISNGSFEGLDSLEELNLKDNSLRALQPGVFSAVPAVRVLYLERNSFERLGPGVFTGRHLENITITDNKQNLTLGNLTFANIPSLKNLILQYNGIGNVPDDLFRGSDSLTTLDLSYNSLSRLPATLFKGLAALKKLDLSNNSISELSGRMFLPLKGLEELNLNGNIITVLPNQLFSGLSSFTKFTIDHNRLHTISEQAFLGAGSLLSVSMAWNSLSLQQGGYQPLESYSPFQYLRNLRILVLRGNLISMVFSDWTGVLLQLTTLDLTDNNFTELVSDEIQFLSNKNTVDLRRNKIAAVMFSGSVLPPSSPSSPSPPGPRTALLLDHNPLRCDCNAYKLSLLLRGAQLPYTVPAFDLGGATCAFPPDKRGRRVDAVRPHEFTCDLERSDCPDTCDSCISRPDTRAVELSCASLPKNLPNLTDYGIGDIKLRLRDIKRLGELPDGVVSLNLSGLGLHVLRLLEQPHLKELDLRNNRLNTIPDHILNSNLVLYLSNNSLKCECDYRNYIRELLARPNVMDKSDITCSDGTRVLDIDVARLCAVRNASLVATAIFVTLLIVATAISILIYNYYQEILVYLTSRGYLKWIITEEILDSDKIYDVFVSYSHLDVEFVRDQLMTKLEDDFKLKACVHDRDWIIGDMIPIQIVRSVEESRRTLIVLSRNFLSSTWAGAEFRAAHCMALREGRARVVLVILDDDVIHDHRLDDDLRAYISTNTYLTRSDAKFWDRLQRALPPRERKFTLLSKFRRSGVVAEKVGGEGLNVQLNSAGQLVNAAVRKDVV